MEAGVNVLTHFNLKVWGVDSYCFVIHTMRMYTVLSCNFEASVIGLESDLACYNLSNTQ